MDELTVERFGPGIPRRELRTRPSPPPPPRRQPKPLNPVGRKLLREMIGVLARAQLEPAWLVAERRLVEAIRGAA